MSPLHCAHSSLFLGTDRAADERGKRDVSWFRKAP
ncbi:hypothetical protein LEMLEM_LOCUS23407 [Lemmus lemmus]